MRLVNTPVFYIPYIVTPSPLRKDRKSGFLSPSMSLNFFDTKTSQSVSVPYYFNISNDKELTFTPILNYGGGVDSSQRFIFNYDQLLSGGNLSTDLTFDSNFEYENNNKWLKDSSLVTNYQQNINANYKLSIESALQTSQNYIQKTQPNDDLSYETSLSTNFKIEGFNINNIDDYFQTNFSFYQTNQENENNEKNPIVFPNITYYSGNKILGNYNISNEYQFYNIFRDTNTTIHSKQQQKLSHTFNLSKDIIKYNSRIDFKTKIYNQFYNTEDKLIETNDYHSGNLYRIFPIIGAKISTPFRFKRNNNFNFLYTPNIQVVLSPGESNTNKISNEDSSNNNFSIDNSGKLNRYSGTDKLDNSKRINYGITVDNKYIKFNILQFYEFTKNSNFHEEQGNNHHLSDLLGSIDYNNKNKFSYNFRYDVNDEFLKEQNINSNILASYGNWNFSYLDQKSKNNNLKKDTETLNYGLATKKFLKFSKFTINGLYDFQKEINTEYKIGYSYFDECFGINVDFYRKSYEEDNLKPQDILTLMFSFKSIGSYKSTILTVSENDKQDIQWEGTNSGNSLFENYD